MNFKKLAHFREFLTDREKLFTTIDRLAAEGYLPIQRGELLKSNYNQTLRPSTYILFNLGVHLSLGAIFAFDIVPLPMGTISRVVWVLCNRIFFEIKCDREKREVHSLPVLFVSMIPWVGYFAYTIPLRKTNEDGAYLFTNHISYLRNNMSLIEYLEGKPGFIRKLIQKLIIPGDIQVYVKSTKGGRQ